MAPKGKKGAGAEKAVKHEEDTEEPLQAVVLVDSFETRFRPFTLERPRCLLPLANTPLIEYTFEFLANAGVEDVFVYCGAHTQQVEQYIQKSKWASSSSPFAKLEIIRSTSRSTGDAMRDLDKRNILKNDFLVVYGDVVSNLPLDDALAAHKARRAADKNAIMTMILREAGHTHRTKAQDAKPVFVIDPSQDRCVHYEEMDGSAPHAVTIDPDLLLQHEELDVRADLIDCGIDICTPDSLALWSDNFDFQAPRRNFLHAVLKDYELNGKTIHAHVVGQRYAARVRDLRAYASVSKDVVGRWAYPLCPDTNLVRGQTYRLLKGNVYKEQDVILARSCLIRRASVVGRGTSVGEGSTITNSIVGRNCVIGRNVALDGAYVWDNATVGDGTVITEAIIASEASVGRWCRVEPGALVSFGVHITDGTVVQGSSRITRVKRKREDEDEVERGEPDVRIVGADGDGFEYEDSDTEEDGVNGLTAPGLVYNMSALTLSSESISTLNSEDDLDSEPAQRDRSAAGSFASVGSDDSSRAVAAARDFHAEATASLFDALEREQDPSNIQLELSGLKLAANASEHAVRRAVTSALLKRISSLVEHGTAVKDAPAKLLPKYRLLLERSMFDKPADERRPDQVDFMLLLQQDCAHRTDGANILFHLAFALSKFDVIDANGFEQWWEDERATASEELKRVREKTGQLIEYILQSDDEDEEEEEESEEDE